MDMLKFVAIATLFGCGGIAVHHFAHAWWISAKSGWIWSF